MCAAGPIENVLYSIYSIYTSSCIELGNERVSWAAQPAYPLLIVTSTHPFPSVHSSPHLLSFLEH